jgi:hypothetical protein
MVLPGRGEAERVDIDNWCATVEFYPGFLASGKPSPFFFD